jgi:hypothetical protein
MTQQYGPLTLNPRHNRNDQQLDVKVMAGENAAVARITFQGLEAFGDSKRAPGDKRDALIGQGLALGRAFRSLGEQLEASANLRMELNR